MRANGMLPLVVAVILSALPGIGYCSDPCMEISGLGGFTLANDPAEVRVWEADRPVYQGFQGQDVLGIECRLLQLRWDSFLGFSYTASGVWGLAEHRELDLDLRSHMLEICAGRGFPLGSAVLAISLGYSYIIDDFSVALQGKPVKKHRVEDSGCVIGARLSVPISGRVAALWDYRVLLRPSTTESGDLSGGAHYAIVQGSVQHFILGGLSIVML
jgi:hypothetical protein